MALSAGSSPVPASPPRPAVDSLNIFNVNGSAVLGMDATILGH